MPRFNHTRLPEGHSELRPRLLVNLASLHDQKLFPAAKQPAVVFIGENCSSTRDALFLFARVEFSRSFRHHGLMRLGPENVQRLSVSVAADNPFALKVASWGSARDLALVNRLTHHYSSLESLLSRHNLEMHQGYIVGNRERDVPKELIGLPCLTGGRMPAFEVDVRHLPRFTETQLQWPRHPDIYRGPLLLCASGLSGNRLGASLCRDDCVFSLSQYGVSFRCGERSLASYLNGIVNSSLATYFVFLTATKWGLDKYEVLSNDYLRLPIPAPDSLPQAVVKELHSLETDLRVKALRGGSDEINYSALDEVVYEMYSLDSNERRLVDDMLDLTIDLQRNHEKSTAVLPPTPDECREYAMRVISVIQPFLTVRNERRLIADVLQVDAPLQAVRFQFVPYNGDGRSTVDITTSADLQTAFPRIEARLDTSIALGLHTRRHLRVYDGDAVYVVKPAQRRFWSASAGLVDGDGVLQDLLARGVDD